MTSSEYQREWRLKHLIGMRMYNKLWARRHKKIIYMDPNGINSGYSKVKSRWIRDFQQEMERLGKQLDNKLTESQRQEIVFKMHSCFAHIKYIRLL